MTGPLPGTPGQTVGPFFGLSLPYAGGPELVPPGAARRDPAARPGAGRRRRPGAGRAARALAARPGRRGRAASPARCTGTAGPSPAGAGPATDNAGHWSFSTLRPGPSRPGGGPVLRADRVRPRPARPAADPGLPAGDEASLAADPLLSGLPAGAAAPRWSPPRSRAGTPSTWCCRASGETVFLESAAVSPVPVARRDAARRARAAAAGRAGARHLRGDAVGPVRGRAGRGLRGGRLGPARARRVGAGDRPVLGRRAGRGRARAGRRTGRSTTRATRSAARSGCSCCSTTRPGRRRRPALHRRPDRHPGELAGAGRAGPGRGHQGGRADGGADLVRARLRRPGAGRRRRAAGPPGRRRRRLVRLGLRGAGRLRRDRPAGRDPRAGARGRRRVRHPDAGRRAARRSPTGVAGRPAGRAGPGRAPRPGRGAGGDGRADRRLPAAPAAAGPAPG